MKTYDELVQTVRANKRVVSTDDGFAALVSKIEHQQQQIAELHARLSALEAWARGASR